MEDKRRLKITVLITAVCTALVLAVILAVMIKIGFFDTPKAAEEAAPNSVSEGTEAEEETPALENKAEEEEKEPEETEPEEAPEPSIYEENREEIDSLLAEAEKMAAGYDPQAAIACLKTFARWEEVPEITERIADYEAADASYRTFENMGGISHVFFHSLIADTDRAFDGDGMQDGYNLYMTTCREFEDILDSLYERGYVLVTPYQVAGEILQEDGSSRFGYLQIRLPEGKTPIMMSQDDVNYYGYMIGATDGVDEIPAFADPSGDGFADRLVIGEDGDIICRYMDAEGNVLYGDYDLVPILEHFIWEHPDFSYRGARAVLGVTAYEGVFGYRTKPSYEAALGTEAYNRELEDAKLLVQALKEKGWIIASHTYGHPALGNVSAEKVATDTEKFRRTAKSVIGETDILIYPHGSDIAGLEKYSLEENEKFRILYEDGFRYFFNVDNCVAWHQLGVHYFRGNRRDLDGFRMYHYPDSMDDIIDAKAILDPARPLPVPEIG